MIKYCAGEWGSRSIDKIMQIFGGLGETLDMPISHWFRLLRPVSYTHLTLPTILRV